MTVRVLGRDDRRAVLALLDADPVLNVFPASRLEAGVLHRLGTGELWGYPGHDPRSLLHVGANLMPVATDHAARRAFAERLGPHRSCCAIVGRADEVIGLWRELTGRWGDPYGKVRLVRHRQPVMATDGICPIDVDPRVAKITLDDVESYFQAAVSMYTEELEENPLLTNAHGYRHYVEGIIKDGRAYGIVVDEEVIFKADVGAVGNGVAQIQGVWVHPRLRGLGLAAPAMAALTNEIVRDGFTASLYVNDFNVPALATYRRCGYTDRGVFTTVLY